jgi:hypothetical protein
MLSFDFDLSQQNHDKTKHTMKRAEALIEIQTILLEMYSELFGTVSFSLEKKRQLAIYFEYLNTLPEELQQRMISNSNSGGVDPRTALPDYTLPRLSTITKDEQQILDELQTILKIQERQEDQQGRFFSDRIILENEFRGLKTGVFPMKLVVKDRKTGKILLFIELEGEIFNTKSETGEGTTLPTETAIKEKRENELKEKLYKFQYLRVPLKRIQLSFRPVKDTAKEILEEIKQILPLCSSSED